MAEDKPAQNISREELIGYHKGSINTLLAERNELLRIAQITEQLIQAHVKELESLGVKLTPSKAETESSENSSSNLQQ
jgi:hypothetical protein